MQVVEVNEGLLYNSLKTIFPDCIVHHNVQKKLKIKYPLGSYMEFDVWIPKYEICFEFQDAHHYVTTWYYQNTTGHVKLKDDIKSIMSRSNNITLLHIPCWWSGDQESLVATIKYERPDLPITFQGKESISLPIPIPLNPPLGFFPEATIPGVGELMLASFPYPKLQSDLSKNIWWTGEKYDGVRCCWNPDSRRSYSRFGTNLPILASMAKVIPKIFLDSEIWFGRGQFSYSYMLVTGTMSSSHSYWSFLRMLSFDIPSYNVQRKPYDERYALLIQSVTPTHPFVIPSFRLLTPLYSLNWFVQQILDGGGEGIILQKRGSMYKQGRSQDIVKLKIAQADAEAIVVGVLPDNSVKLKLPNGTQFTVPADSIHTPYTPPIATVVSFSFENFARREIPTNPEIIRIREDLTWEEVVRSYEKDKNYLSKISTIKGYTTKPKGYWTTKNMRAYMEEFAKRRDMDPLQIDTWYKLYTEFHKSKSGRIILGKFQNFYRALRHLFPETSFSSVLKPAYDKLENRRKFFENYARKYKFDSLKPENWYIQSYKRILATKGAHTVIMYHSYNVPKALMDLFPNIGLERIKFQFRQNIWESKSNRRLYFEKYAEANGFNPLVPDNWYKQSPLKLASTKGTTRVLFYHGGSIATALCDLFPEIGLVRERFSKLPGVYHTREGRRDFFVNYAKENNFDPLLPTNWYIQPKEKIMESKGARMVLHYYATSLSAALIDLFPNIGLEKNKFQVTASVWASHENRRKFFEEYAKSQNFDSSNVLNWMAHSARKIMGTKGGRNVILHHGNSFGQALQELFPKLKLDLEEYYENNWFDSSAKRRKYFEDIAKEANFDANIPENWYSFSLESLKSKKDMYTVLYYYSNSITKALSELFSNSTVLDRSKFSRD